ncbi:hypothetical protein C9439_01345 [archaeon SCG-AAA382B04]|nr:hypothetical protein C9439_01345 [archaeon SCG-AAA382B04]
MGLEGGLLVLKIESVFLKNIKSYKKEKIRFKEGVNAIAGENGAGKTTILEAVGYVLFDYLPFSQQKFIRRGSNEGKVVVSLAIDGKDFKVTRKCNASDHLVTSGGGKKKIVSGVNDVKKWVSENIVSVHRNELDKVFSNAIGVPQGKFTSSFLESKSARQKIFDPILGVDEYREAFDNLRSPLQNIEEEKRKIKDKIIELRAKTSNLDQKKEKKENLVQKIHDYKEKLEKSREKLEKLEENKKELEETKEQIRQFKNNLREVENKKENLIEKKKEIKSDLEGSKEAKKIVDSNKKDKKKFEKVKKTLKDLKQKRKKLEKLKDEKNSIEKALVKLKGKRDSIKDDLNDVKGYEKELEEIKDDISIFKDLEDKRNNLLAKEKSLKNKVEDLKEKKEKSIPKKGVCPIFEGVECKSIDDMEHYFNQQISELSNKLDSVDDEKQRINKKIDEFDYNPKERVAFLKDQIKNKEKIKSELKKLNKKIDSKETELDRLKEQISDFEDLKSRLVSLEDKRDRLEQSAKKYDRKIETAELLDKRKDKLKNTKNQLEKVKEKEKKLNKKIKQKSEDFSPDKLEKMSNKTKKIREKVVSLKSDLKNSNNLLDELKSDIDRLEQFKEKNIKLEEELDEVSDFYDFFDFSRTILKDAAPHIAKAFVEKITQEADQFYKEITNDYTQNLTWNKDYEIIIKKGGRKKAFNQLSGGEKMAAAISVRLSLLKTISDSKIVFLDEPTVNMDETRRKKLADQIQQIDGFNQIFVISHDDTFNSAIEDVTKIVKQNGVSKVKEGGL